MKNGTALALLLVSGVYLLNFTVGIFELPDYLPIIGNLDEAAASLVFISALKHFGIDLTELFLASRSGRAGKKVNS